MKILNSERLRDGETILSPDPSDMGNIRVQNFTRPNHIVSRPFRYGEYQGSKFHSSKPYCLQTLQIWGISGFKISLVQTILSPDPSDMGNIRVQNFTRPNHIVSRPFRYGEYQGSKFHSSKPYCLQTLQIWGISGFKISLVQTILSPDPSDMGNISVQNFTRPNHIVSRPFRYGEYQGSKFHSSKPYCLQTLQIWGISGFKISLVQTILSPDPSDMGNIRVQNFTRPNHIVSRPFRYGEYRGSKFHSSKPYCLQTLQIWGISGFKISLVQTILSPDPSDVGNIRVQNFTRPNHIVSRPFRCGEYRGSKFHSSKPYCLQTLQMWGIWGFKISLVQTILSPDPSDMGNIRVQNFTRPNHIVSRPFRYGEYQGSKFHSSKPYCLQTLQIWGISAFKISLVQTILSPDPSDMGNIRVQNFTHPIVWDK